MLLFLVGLALEQTFGAATGRGVSLPSSRAFLLSSSFWHCGVSLLLIHGLCSCLSDVCLGIPESPRFLIAKDRFDDALNVLAKYHTNGNKDHPTVQFEYQEIRDTIKLEQAAKESSSYLDFFRTKGNRYRLAIIVSMGFFSQWSGNAIVSNYSSILYGNVGISSSLEILGISAGQFTLGAIVSITCALMVDRFGRRPTWLISTGGMLVCLVLWTVCYGLFEQHGANKATTAVIFFIWLHGFFYSIAWSGLLIGYAIEILPYTLRAKGMMLVNLCINGSLAVNQQLNPIAFDHWKGETWKLYTIYCVSPLLLGCLVWHKLTPPCTVLGPV